MVVFIYDFGSVRFVMWNRCGSKDIFWFERLYLLEYWPNKTYEAFILFVCENSHVRSQWLMSHTVPHTMIRFVINRIPCWGSDLKADAFGDTVTKK